MLELGNQENSKNGSVNKMCTRS